MKNSQKVLLTLLAATATTLGGCSAVGISSDATTTAMAPGVVNYSAGELKVIEDVNIDTVWTATLKALDELEIKVVEKTKDKLSGKISARRADDTKVTISLNKGLKDITVITIRAGTLGNETVSEAIYGQIKSNL